MSARAACGIGHGTYPPSIRHLDAELPQLAHNARRAPQRIRAGDLPDELADLLADRRPAGLSSSAHARPVITKAFSLPSDHGCGLNEDQCLPP